MVSGVLSTALSALRAQSQKLGAIAQNVANVQTNGYRDEDVAFSSFSAEAGGGVRGSRVVNAGAQGPLAQTGNATDLALSGNGFFPVQDPQSGETLFTRNGDFRPDSQGFLTNSNGQRLLGLRLDSNAALGLDALEPVRADALAAAPNATSEVALRLNLDADEAVSAAGDPPDFTRDVRVFDSLGSAQDLSLDFTRTSTTPGQFQLDIRAPNGSVLASQSLDFNGSGQLNSAGSFTVSNIDFGNGAAVQDMTFDVSDITQFSGGYNVTSIAQDGFGAADFSSLSVGGDGIVTAQFSNGASEALFRVPVAQFAAPEGLNVSSGQTFRATAASGPVNLQFAGENGAARIQSASLEGSTVSLDQQLTDQIVADAAYRASLAVVRADNEIADALLDIKS